MDRQLDLQWSVYTVLVLIELSDMRMIVCNRCQHVPDLTRNTGEG
jgi:hypothetical protein